MTSPTMTVFNTVLGGPTVYLYGAGWTLLGVGFATSWAADNMKLALGEIAEPRKGVLWVQLFFSIAAMGLYTSIAGGIWWFFQTTAANIYPHSAFTGISNLMGIAVRRFQDYSFNAMTVVSSAKEGVVVFGSLAAFIIALLGYWNAQTFQVIGYNVIFALGPLLIGLNTFGIPGIRTWLLILVEISSWTVIQAVIFRTIEGKLIYYLQRAAELPLLSVEFLDIFGQLTVLATLPIIVPALAGRLFGMGAGAAFAQAPNLLSPQMMAAAAGGFFGSRAGSTSKKSDGGLRMPNPANLMTGNDGDKKKSESRRGGDV